MKFIDQKTPVYSAFILDNSLFYSPSVFFVVFIASQVLTFWLFAENLITDDSGYVHHYKVGEQLNDESLPDWMITQEMKQAVSTLNTFQNSLGWNERRRTNRSRRRHKRSRDFC